MNNNTKGSVGPLVIVLIAVIVAGGVYLFSQKNQEVQDSTNVQTTTQVQSTQQTQSAVGAQKEEWKKYTNQTYGFSFSYPRDWELKNLNNSDPYNIVTVLEKNGYTLRFYINNQGKGRESLASSKDYRPLFSTNGIQVWRTIKPELPELGNTPFFQPGVLTPYSGNLDHFYDKAFSSIISQKENFAFSVFYALPSTVTETTYDSAIINEMDKITQTILLGA